MMRTPAPFTLLLPGLLLGPPAAAEAVLDGSTGSSGSFSGDFEIPATVGRQLGANLFHSFESFRIRNGESATFTGPGGIDNVISRVTGGERSRINGPLVSTIPAADFFFLNPSGVVFGPNATLDVEGSFHVSTADELRFADGTRLGASAPEGGSFTAAAPELFGFLGDEAGRITLDRGRLAVGAGETLSLIGGSIAATAGGQGFADGGTAGQMLAPGGTVLLVAVADRSEVALDGATGADAFADIRLTGQAVVEVSGDGGGTVRIRAHDLLLAEESFVFAENAGFAAPRAGIDIEAAGVTIRSGAGLTTDAFAGGDGARLRIRADEVVIADAGTVASSAFAGGSAGRIVVEAGRLVVDGRSSGGATGIITDTVAGTGDAGPIVITADDLRVRAGGRISSGTSAAGRAGPITIDSGRVLISGAPEGVLFTGISSSAEFGSAGDGGTVRLRADEVELRDGGVISSGALGFGRGGTLTIEAGLLDARGAGIEATSAGPGAPGRIELDVGRLHLRDQGFVSAVALGPDDGDPSRASIEVTAATEILITGREVDAPSVISTLTTGTRPAGAISIATPILRMPRFATINSSSASLTAPAGAIDIEVDRLEMGRATLVDSSSLGGELLGRPDATAAAGRITIRAADSIAMAGGPGGEVAGIGTITTTAGAGGSIDVTTGLLRLETATITTGSVAGGDAGDIVIAASDRLQMDDGAIATDADIAGGGQVRIEVGELIDLRGSEITTSVAGDTTTTAGDVDIDPRFLIIDDSRIVAQADAGRGGNIRIEVGTLLTTADGLVSASAGPAGIDGTVDITAPDLDLTSELAVLPTAFVDVSGLLRESCAARGRDEASSFAAGGGRALSPDPGAPLRGRYGPIPSPATFHHWSLNHAGACDG